MSALSTASRHSLTLTRMGRALVLPAAPLSHLNRSFWRYYDVLLFFNKNKHALLLKLSFCEPRTYMAFLCVRLLLSVHSTTQGKERY